MRIVIMLRHFEQHDGGVKVYTHNVLHHLLRLGQQHEFVLAYRHPRLLGTYARHHNVREVAMRMPGSVPWDQLAVPWIARRSNADLIFNPKFTVPLLGRARKVYVLHGSEWFALADHHKWFDRLYVRLSFPVYTRVADAIITVAQKVKDDALPFTRAQPSKFVPIHNGFDAQRFRVLRDPQALAAVRRKYDLPEKFIFWAGQIDARKNLTNLLRAYARLRDRIPHDLVLAGNRNEAGRRTWKRRGEMELMRELGLARRVRLVGWVPHEDLPAVYNLAAAFALPSLHEGFGIPLLEAMACGCPVVTSTTGSAPEVTAGAAQLADPYDPADIARALDTVLGDETLRAQLVARGLARVKDFGWERCARSLLDLFESLAPAGTTDRRVRVAV